MQSSSADQPSATAKGTTNALAPLNASLRFVSAHKWLFISIGVVSVVVHFWRIRYLPQMTVVDIGLIAAATVFFTLIAIALFLIIVLGPSQYFTIWSNVGFIPRAPSSRLRERRSRLMSPSYPTYRQLASHAKARSSIITRTMLPIILIAYGAFLTAAAAWTCVSYLPEYLQTTVAIGIFSPSLFGFLIGSWANAPQDVKTRLKRRSKRWLKYFGLCFSLYATVIPFVVLAGHVFLKGVNESQDPWNLAWLLCVPIIHVTIYAAQRNKPLVLVTSVLFMAFAITFFTGAIFQIGDLAAANFRLGMMKKQNVLVTPLGCDLARLSGVVQKCSIITGESGRQLCLTDVQILTRIGSHFVVANSQWTPQKPIHSTPIPATEVLGWFGSYNLQSTKDSTPPKHALTCNAESKSDISE